jgi:hypothetical protein
MRYYKLFLKILLTFGIFSDNIWISAEENFLAWLFLIVVFNKKKASLSIVNEKIIQLHKSLILNYSVLYWFIHIREVLGFSIKCKILYPYVCKRQHRGHHYFSNSNSTAWCVSSKYLLLIQLFRIKKFLFQLPMPTKLVLFSIFFSFCFKVGMLIKSCFLVLIWQSNPNNMKLKCFW